MFIARFGVAGALAPLLPIALGGCWKLETADLPIAALDFTPGVGGPEDWRVTPISIGLECPDGEDVRFHLVHPAEADPTTTSLPVAIVFHGGAFDFVIAPNASDPVDGTHYAEPSRLELAFPVQQSFAVLGMYPSIPDTIDDGTLASALTSRGVALLLPGNCWGDLWHNSRGIVQNDTTQDFFFRDGRTAAEWAFRMTADPVFRAGIGVEFPFSPDVDHIYLVGLAEGARAVSEVLTVDVDRDGDADLHPTAIVLDNANDDLTPTFANPALYGNRISGLLRIFPDGSASTSTGSLSTAPLPPRVAYLYSTSNPTIPPDAHGAALAALAGHPGASIRAVDSAAPILLDGADPALTDEVVDWLTSDL